MDSNKNPRYIFWLDDLTVLYKNENYLSFIPLNDNTMVENLNAITRFCIYYTIIIMLFNKSIEYYYFSLIVVIFVIVLYYIWKSDKNKNLLDTPYVYETLNRNNINNNINNNTNNNIEAGYIDSDNQMHLGSYYSQNQKPKVNKLSVDQLLAYQKGSCRKPTRDNPFMNPRIIDYNNQDQPVACNGDDEDIKDGVEDNFNKDLFRDIDDLFNIKNSQRQFYTVPNTQIPNDQPSFANWLYKTPYTCKEDQEACLRYEDIRYGRLFPSSSRR